MDLSSLTLGERIVELARLATAMHWDEALKVTGRPSENVADGHRNSDPDARSRNATPWFTEDSRRPFGTP
jgi:hypothetical protein